MPSVGVDQPCQAEHAGAVVPPVCNNAMYNCLSVCNRWEGEGERASLVYFSLSP